MEPARQCANCGLELTDVSAATCPTCGARVVRTASHPVLIRIVDLGIAFFVALFMMILVFGLPFFLNNRAQSQAYAGQNFHVSNFTVTQVYYQPRRGPHGVDNIPSLLAKGTVEGNVEWMNLRPYVPAQP